MNPDCVKIAVTSTSNCVQLPAILGDLVRRYMIAPVSICNDRCCVKSIVLLHVLKVEYADMLTC